MGEGELGELADRVRLTRGDDEVAGLVVLQHQNHRLHVLRRVTPITSGIKVAEVEFVL